MRLRAISVPFVFVMLFCGTDTAAADPPDSSLKTKVATTIQKAADASTFLVQMLDAVSTQRVLQAGGRELNPLLRPFVGNEPLWYGFKSVSAAAYVLAEHSLGRRHKFLAIGTTLAINGVYFAVARHNFGVAAQLRAQQAAQR